MDMLRCYLVLVSLGVASIGTVSGIALCDVCECFPQRGGLVNCTGKHLTELPELTSKNISVLILSDNKITSIPEDTLLVLDALTEIYLDKNNLSKLPNFPKLIQRVHAGDNNLTEMDTALQNLPNIIYLKLPRNDIMRLREDAFNGSTKLSYIDLDGNKIETIDSHAFRGLENMNNVTLSNNSLEELPTNVLDLNQDGTINIYLHNNEKLENLSRRTFDNCPVNTSLYLQHCGLNKIAKGMFDGCRRIWKLELSNNQIASIDEEAFSDIISIFALYLDNNNLIRISSAIRLCPITRLFLNFNDITSLGSERISSDETKVLMLTRNKIENISKANFNGMKNLKVLMMGNNNISHIDELAFNGTNLSALYLYGNQLKLISRTSFQMIGRSNLAYLYLHGNTISKVDEECFANVDTAYIACEHLHMIPEMLGENVAVYCVFEDSEVTLKGLTTDLMEENEIITKIDGVECHGTPPTCMFCTNGTFGGKDGDKSICLKCPPGGYYQDMIGIVKTRKYTTDCKRCPKGTLSKNPGAASKGNCLTCPVGTQTNASAGLNACDCLPMFHRVNRYGSCTPCPRKGVNCSGGYQRLQNGFWWSWEFGSSTCQHFGSKDEYDGFINRLKNMNFDIKEPEQLKDVVYNGSLPAVHQCPRNKNCISNGTSATCAEGYEGWLCTVCKRGYFRGGNSLLSKCHKCYKSQYVISILIFLFLLLILILYTIWKYRNYLSQKYYQRKIYCLTMYVKFIINYYQVIGILDLYKYENASLYLDVVGYIYLLSPRCVSENISWNANKQFVLLICVPVAIILIAIGAAAYSVIKIKRRQNDDGSSLVTTHFVFFAVLVLLYFTYASVCTDIMAIGPWTYRTFNTIQFNADEGCTQTMINSDYSIIINETNQNAYELLCYIFIVVYIFGFPIALFCILCYLHYRGIIGKRQNYQPMQGTDVVVVDDDDENDHNDSAQIQSLSFFHAQYTTWCWWWEVLEIFIKAGLAFVANWERYEESDVVISIVVIAALVLLHVLFHPIKYTLAQRFQITTLIFVIVNLAVNLPVVDDASTKSIHRIWSVILKCFDAFLIVVFIFVVIVAVIQLCFRDSKLEKWVTSKISKTKIYHQRDSI